MIAEIPAACAEPDLVRQILGLSLIFIAGLIAGVTLAIVVNKPPPQPWWMQE